MFFIRNLIDTSLVVIIYLFPISSSILDKVIDRRWENGERYSLGGLDGGRSGHDHKYTVNQYRGDDEEGKERVNQYVNGHTSYWVERIEHPHRVRRWEPEYVLSFANDDEGLQTNTYFKIHRCISAAHIKRLEERVHFFSIALCWVLCLIVCRENINIKIM